MKKKNLRRVPRDLSILAMIRGEAPGSKPKTLPSKKRYRRKPKHKKEWE